MLTSWSFKQKIAITLLAWVLQCYDLGKVLYGNFPCLCEMVVIEIHCVDSSVNPEAGQNTSCSMKNLKTFTAIG